MDAFGRPTTCNQGSNRKHRSQKSLFHDTQSPEYSYDLYGMDSSVSSRVNAGYDDDRDSSMAFGGLITNACWSRLKCSVEYLEMFSNYKPHVVVAMLMTWGVISLEELVVDKLAFKALFEI